MKCWLRSQQQFTGFLSSVWRQMKGYHNGCPCQHAGKTHGPHMAPTCFSWTDLSLSFHEIAATAEKNWKAVLAVFPRCTFLFLQTKTFEHHLSNLLWSLTSTCAQKPSSAGLYIHTVVNSSFPLADCVTDGRKGRKWKLPGRGVNGATLGSSRKIGVVVMKPHWGSERFTPGCWQMHTWTWKDVLLGVHTATLEVKDAVQTGAHKDFCRMLTSLVRPRQHPAVHPSDFLCRRMYCRMLTWPY